MAVKPISRREFVRIGTLSGGALAIAACSGGDEAAPESSSGKTVKNNTPDDVVMVSDVERYVLTTDEWEPDFGWVRFKMHEGRYNGEAVHYIRTDASNAEFAEQEGLVHVPLLNAARGLDVANIMYAFSDDRPNVLKYIPTDENYSSLFDMINVSGDGEFDSAEAIEAAATSGDITLEETGIFCNFPLVIWPGGGLPVDDELTAALGKGPLVEAPDTNAGTVRFKLHKCYPGSRYIVTDTSAVPMAGMMGIIGSGVTQALREAGGTDEIWVFGNGIPGPGAMGFQPAIFDNKAGEPAWSPFWDHYTVVWTDEENARVLTSSAEVKAAIDAGELEEFAGTPDTNGMGFVVNCPAPILSPTDFAA